MIVRPVEHRFSAPKRNQPLMSARLIIHHQEQSRLTGRPPTTHSLPHPQFSAVLCPPSSAPPFIYSHPGSQGDSHQLSPTRTSPVRTALHGTARLASTAFVHPFLRRGVAPHQPTNPPTTTESTAPRTSGQALNGQRTTPPNRARGCARVSTLFSQPLFSRRSRDATAAGA